MNDFLLEIKEEKFNDVVLTDDDLVILFKQLDSLKKQYLYKSNFHGLFHSEKVLLFSYLLGKKQGLDDTEMQIIMDAAMYHDIGRSDETEDGFHGYTSSCLLQQQTNNILSSKIYENKNNLDYLRAICDVHSKRDEENKRIFNNYLYENDTLDFDEFEKLANILKDADALDRTRFATMSMASLQDNFLRSNYARNLIDFAKSVNWLYILRDINRQYSKLNAEYGKKENELDKCPCFHGIGADFFKLESILDKGILSYYSRRMEGLEVSSNFHGSNGVLWVSVVDGNMVSKNEKAFKSYIEEGISLFCFVPKLKDGNGNLGLADTRDKNEYLDEKYVFDKIEPSQIHSIIVPGKMMNKQIDKLNYLRCSSQYDIVRNVVNYYKNEMIKRGYKVDFSKVSKYLEELNQERFRFESLPNNIKELNKDSYFNFLDSIKETINIEVQKWFKGYYCNKLDMINTENTIVTVFDVMKDFAKENNLNNVYIGTDEETIFVINELEFQKDKINSERKK